MWVRDKHCLSGEVKRSLSQVLQFLARTDLTIIKKRSCTFTCWFLFVVDFLLLFFFCMCVCVCVCMCVCV